MNAAAILVAAGQGTRMGLESSKTLVLIGGKPAVRRAAETLLACCETLVAVIRPEEEQAFRQALDGLPVLFAWGGATRRHSVENGLNALPEGADIVLVHDGARPLVDTATVRRVIEGAEKHGAAIPGVRVQDTLKRAGEDGAVLATVAREQLWQVQTPQGFRAAWLREAYRLYPDATTDDAGLIEKMGRAVYLVEGDKRNIKLTTRGDVAMAEACVAKYPRIGMGYDVHRLQEGRRLVLCGQGIPWDKGLLGHSDADVALHALMDALLGAAALGDIGRHFPDTDQRFSGADSVKLLMSVKEILAAHGFVPYNVDITIAAQRPRLAPYMDAMRGNVARALALPMDRVSVKATTTERLGFVGRGEGISASAVAQVLQESF